MVDVEGGIMCNHDVGTSQPDEQFGGDRGKCRGVENVQMR